MRSWLSKFIHRKRRRFCASLVRTYREISPVSADELWQKLVDLGDVSWHPLFKSTCVHSGFGLGFERLVLFVTGMGNIRDVIPYPRTPLNAEF